MLFRSVVWLQTGDTLPVADGTLRVLGPVRMDEEKENNNSVVLRLDTAAGSILLTGDMEKKSRGSTDGCYGAFARYRAESGASR